MFRLDPSAGYFIPDSAIIYLPIQLCIWVAAYLKEASPDPPEDASRLVCAPVIIDSTPLLGELLVLPYTAPDKQCEQDAKGVKRSVDNAPEEWDEVHNSLGKTVGRRARKGPKQHRFLFYCRR